MEKMIFLSLLLLFPACKLALKIPEIKSAKTELEEQVLGSWQKIDHDLILMSTVRGEGSSSRSTHPYEQAKKNRAFNQDDLDELRDQQIIGERYDGHVVILDQSITGVIPSDGSLQKLAKIIVAEENRDRKILWENGTSASHATGAAQVDSSRKIWTQDLRKHLKAGVWYQNEAQKWVRKAAP
ncbi:MAG: DUF1318 domain-containing protein [Deltaproteobacteria bacterium]|nr:DUF1318 domain-containing protein [Deltaproteobacteria bacterium]